MSFLHLSLFHNRPGLSTLTRPNKQGLYKGQGALGLKLAKWRETMFCTETAPVGSLLGHQEHHPGLCALGAGAGAKLS